MNRLRVAGAAALVLAAGSGVLALLRPPVAAPVTVDLGGLGSAGAAAPAVIAHVAVHLAAVLPAAAAGLLLLLRPTRRAGLPVTGVAAPVVVFLVAQLNGITDVGALVLTYAVAGGSVLLRAAGTERGVRLAGVLGIVPWGVIAFHQVGALLTGRPFAAGVVVTTLAVLAGSIAEYVVAARTDGDPADALAALPPVLLAVLATATV